MINMANYFNTLPLREKLNQLGQCRFMDRSEFADGCEALKGKKVDYWLWRTRLKPRSKHA